MTMMKTLDGMIEINVGDTVGFKSDYEQYGKVTKIERSQFGSGYQLTVENPSGFGGEYLRYATTTVVSSNDVWVD